NSDEDNRDQNPCAEDDRDNQGNCEYAYSLCERPGAEEQGGREQLEPAPETFLHKLIGREEFTGEVSRYQDEADDDSSQQIAERKLEKGHIRAVGESGCADDGEDARFSRHYGKCDGPPREAASAEEIVAQGVLAFAKVGSEYGDRDQVSDDDGEVQPT